MNAEEQGTARGHTVRRVVIAGDGLVAWLAGAALARTLPAGEWSIHVLAVSGSDDAESSGDADATLPLSVSELRTLTGDENALLETTGGTFTLGIAFAGWSSPDATWFQPFGATGAALGPVPFHHLALRLRREGRPLRFADYSLAALAAQAGRFSRPDRDPHSVLSTLRYGLHVDTRKLAKTLRATAEAAGVRSLDGSFARAERAGDGSIAALLTVDGTRIEGDLFLDCSGPQAKLCDDSPTDWLDWSRWLPCDRVIRATVPGGAAPPPYSLARAHRGGWIRQLPLQDRSSLLGFYRGETIDDDAVFELLQRSADGAALADPATYGLQFGRRASAWQGNCVALGTAAACIDPLVASNLQLALSGIDRLLCLLPGRMPAKAVAAEYNRRAATWLDHARDFALLHYKLNGRRGEALWDACRDMPIPDTLEYKLALYRSRGRVVMYDEEPFEESAWIGLFEGMGVEPRRYGQAADGFASADIDAHCRRVREVMLDALRRMPPHAEHLATAKQTL